MKFLGNPSSGSIAGTTYSHNRVGQYVRNRRAPVQPVGSGRRGFIRAAFSAASTAWAALTSLQREAWNGFATEHPVHDSLGQSFVLTGHQMFVAVGTNLQNVGQGLPTVPPASTALPDVASATLECDVTDGISIDSYSGSADDFIAVGLSRQISPGRSFNKTFWQPAAGEGYEAAGTQPKIIATAIYAAEFGTPVAGMKLMVRITPVNQYGFAGAPVILQALWTA